MPNHCRKVIKSRGYPIDYQMLRAWDNSKNV